MLRVTFKQRLISWVLRKGQGVFATARICKGDFVLGYRGWLITRNCIQKNNLGTVFTFDFQWKGKQGSVDASLGRLVNDEHKKPNYKIKVIEVDGKPHLC